MKSHTRLIRKIKKINALNAELKAEIAEYVSANKNRLDQETMNEFLSVIGPYHPMGKGIMQETYFVDTILQLYSFDENTEIISNVYDIDDNLLFSIDGFVIKSFCRDIRIMHQDGNLFFNGLAFISAKTGRDDQIMGIISDKGKIVVKPVFKEIYFIYNLCQVTYFLVIDQSNKQGIIDQTGRVIIPIVYSDIRVFNICMSYDTDFIAIKNNKYYIIHWSCQYKSIDGKYQNLGESYKIREIFNSFSPSRNNTYLGVKIKNYGWYDHALNPILKCRYKKICVFSAEDDIYNENLFAIYKEHNNKWGFYKMKGQIDYSTTIKLPAIYDRIVVSDTLNFVVLIKNKQKLLYDFARKITIAVPGEILPGSIIMKTHNKQVYFVARKSKTKKWAVLDSGFNKLTEYHFPYPPELDLYNKKVSAFVPEFRYKDASLANCYKYNFGWQNFFMLFGIHQPASPQLTNLKIDKAQIQRIKKTGIIYANISVAGYQYYDFYDICEHIRPKDELIMIGEPDNPYDKFAIALYFKHAEKDYKLGYIPRSINKDMRSYLHDGSELKIIVKRIKASDKIEYFDIDIIGV